MVQDLSPATYWMIFVFAGLAWAGLAALGLALYIGVQRITDRTPKPDRWAKDWESIEREINR